MFLFAGVSRSVLPGGWRILIEPELHFPDPSKPGAIDALVPDLAGWRRERMPVLPSTAYFTLAPDWICEVLSPSTEEHDREVKMPVYARERVLTRGSLILSPECSRSTRSTRRGAGASLLSIATSRWSAPRRSRPSSSIYRLSGRSGRPTLAPSPAFAAALRCSGADPPKAPRRTRRALRVRLAYLRSHTPPAPVAARAAPRDWPPCQERRRTAGARRPGPGVAGIPRVAGVARVSVALVAGIRSAVCVDVAPIRIGAGERVEVRGAATRERGDGDREEYRAKHEGNVHPSASGCRLRRSARSKQGRAGKERVYSGRRILQHRN